LDELVDAGAEEQVEVGVAAGLGGQEVEEPGLGQHRDEGELGLEEAEAADLQLAAGGLEAELVDLGVGELEDGSAAELWFERG
jgi:hypothetical protein